MRDERREENTNVIKTLYHITKNSELAKFTKLFLWRIWLSQSDHWLVSRELFNSSTSRFFFLFVIILMLFTKEKTQKVPNNLVWSFQRCDGTDGHLFLQKFVSFSRKQKRYTFLCYCMYLVFRLMDFFSQLSYYDVFSKRLRQFDNWQLTF